MADWFVSKDGKTHGPFSSSQLKQLAAAEKIHRDTEVRLGANGTWSPAKNVNGLFVAMAATVVPAAMPTTTMNSTPPPLVARPPTPAQIAALRESAAGEKELIKVYPSYIRNDPIGFCTLIFFGILGLVVAMIGRMFSAQYNPYHVIQLSGLAITLFCGLRFLIAWLRYRKISLVVTDRRTTLRYGLLSRYAKEIRHSDVRMLVVKQRFLQRLFGVGGLDVSSAASDESDIRITGIANPERVKELIDSLRP